MGQNNIRKYYKTFSGTDTIAFIILPGCKAISLGQLTTISYSMFRIKKPVLSVGRTNVSGMTRGSRIYAGTMVFTMINQHWLVELAEQIEWVSSYKDIKCDELPMFDIMILSANEYGSYVWLYISGADFTDEQQTLSIEDMFTENVFQFVARDISPFQAGPVTESDPKPIFTKVKQYSNGFFIVDSSIADTSDLVNGYDERIKEIAQARQQNPVKSLERDLYLKNDGILMSGSDVLAVQRMLYNDGYSCPTNGTFDDATKNAVKMFQSKNGLGINGIVDNNTYLALLYKQEELPQDVIYYGNIVNKNGANVYSKPDVNSDIVDILSYNESIPIYGEA